MRATFLMALALVLAPAFAASVGASQGEIRSTLVMGGEPLAFATPGLPVEPSAKGSVPAIGTTLWAYPSTTIEPSAKGPVPHISFGAN